MDAKDDDGIKWNTRFNCICGYVEVEYEEDDEELELMKKVMGFNHFDTTKVGVVNMLFTYPATIYNIDKYMLGWLHLVCSIMVLCC